MDFFYVWLRRSLHGLSPEIDAAFREPLAPKWDHKSKDGELIDDASRFGGDRKKSRAAYEEGMYRAFVSCHRALRPEGRLVVVFANKQPAAWETLVASIIRAGFVVNGSWPIQTEMGNRTRALASSALSSSVWLVCKKRPETARPGWDNKVLAEMEEKITTKLRDFWDAGIRGPDFVWAATGPALEAYSKHPAVKKANEPGQLMTVSEFLSQVRRMVVDFVVGRVLSGGQGRPPHQQESSPIQAVSGLDEVTTYYLLHRHDFGMEEAPIGPCILYAISCGLSDGALVDQYDLLIRTGGQETEAEDDEDENPEEAGGDARPTEEGGSGSQVKLKPWNRRTRPHMGYDPAVDSKRARQEAKTPRLPTMEKAPAKPRGIPLIDQVHRLMHLWKAGVQAAVNEYLEVRGLLRHPLFHQLLQALIELAPRNSEERSLLESLSNHVSAKRAPQKQQLALEAASETGE